MCLYIRGTAPTIHVQKRSDTPNPSTKSLKRVKPNTRKQKRYMKRMRKK